MSQSPAQFSLVGLALFFTRCFQNIRAVVMKAEAFGNPSFCLVLFSELREMRFRQKLETQSRISGTTGRWRTITRFPPGAAIQARIVQGRESNQAGSNVMEPHMQGHRFIMIPFLRRGM